MACRYWDSAGLLVSFCGGSGCDGGPASVDEASRGMTSLANIPVLPLRPPSANEGETEALPGEAASGMPPAPLTGVTRDGGCWCAGWCGCSCAGLCCCLWGRGWTGCCQPLRPGDPKGFKKERAELGMLYCGSIACLLACVLVWDDEVAEWTGVAVMAWHVCVCVRSHERGSKFSGHRVSIVRSIGTWECVKSVG